MHVALRFGLFDAVGDRVLRLVRRLDFAVALGVAAHEKVEELGVALGEALGGDGFRRRWADQPARASIFSARAKSRALMPPASWVVRSIFTVL